MNNLPKVDVGSSSLLVRFLFAKKIRISRLVTTNASFNIFTPENHQTEFCQGSNAREQSAKDFCKKNVSSLKQNPQTRLMRTSKTSPSSAFFVLYKKESVKDATILSSVRVRV